MVEKIIRNFDACVSIGIPPNTKKIWHNSKWKIKQFQSSLNFNIQQHSLKHVQCHVCCHVPCNVQCNVKCLFVCPIRCQLLYVVSKVTQIVSFMYDFISYAISFFVCSSRNWHTNIEIEPEAPFCMIFDLHLVLCPLHLSLPPGCMHHPKQWENTNTNKIKLMLSKEAKVNLWRPFRMPMLCALKTAMIWCSILLKYS